jgi:hypothetical protein
MTEDPTVRRESRNRRRGKPRQDADAAQLRHVVEDERARSQRRVLGVTVDRWKVIALCLGVVMFAWFVGFDGAIW